MRSKKIRKVTLKTPSLRRVRDNLRIILKLAVKKELRKLDKIYYLYKYKRILTPSQQKRKIQLGEKWKDLDRAYYKSTLQCGCGAGCISFQEAKKHGFNPRDRPIDLDLVWVPWLESWVCTDCFKIGRYDEMTHEDFDDPVTREWVKEEFGI